MTDFDLFARRLTRRQFFGTQAAGVGFDSPALFQETTWRTC